MQKKTLIQSIPNFSEGRDLKKVEHIVDAFRGIPGLKLLDFRIKEVQSLITPVNWGPTFRTYPFEVKYWRQRPIKQHWENIEKASDPEFRPYLTMFGTPDSEAATSFDSSSPPSASAFAISLSMFASFFSRGLMTLERSAM